MSGPKAATITVAPVATAGAAPVVIAALGAIAVGAVTVAAANALRKTIIDAREQYRQEEEKRRQREIFNRARERYDGCRRQIDGMLDKLAGELEKAEKLRENGGGGDGGAARRALEELKREFQKMPSDAPTADATDELRKQAEKIYGTLRQTLAQCSREYAAAERKFRSRLEAAIAAGFAAGPALPPDDGSPHGGPGGGARAGRRPRTAEETAAELAAREAAAIKHIGELLRQAEDLALPADLAAREKEIRERLRTIDSADFLENFCAVTVTPFVRDCKRFRQLEKEHGEEFAELVGEYRVRAREAGETAQEYALTEDNLLELRKEVSRLKMMMRERAKKEYIRQSVDEVMTEMGYDLLGKRETTKKSGKSFQHKLYEFSEGTAVDVTFADDGQMVMELGGMDETDRVPDAGESEKLCGDMEKFCGAYALIKEKLRARGLEISQISMLPPTAEHAQIINIADYELTENAPWQVTKKTAKEQKTQARARE